MDIEKLYEAVPRLSSFFFIEDKIGEGKFKQFKYQHKLQILVISS